MAQQELRTEMRLTVSEDVRLKMEALKNRLGASQVSDVLLRGLVLLDYAINVERQGGKVLIELPGKPITQLRMHDDPNRSRDQPADLREPDAGNLRASGSDSTRQGP